jgi:protein-disulfide isomerase
MSRSALLLTVCLALAAPSGCDQKSDDELRTMMAEVAETRAKTLEERIDALETENAELGKTRKAQAEQVQALEDELVKLTPVVTDAHTGLADVVARLDTLEAKPVPTTPTVPAGKPDPAVTYKVELGDAPADGPDTALVTVVIWSDFQCPYCQRVVATLDTLRTDYGSDLRLVFKHNPLAFHPNALPAAKAAMAAHEQGKFWEMHDKLFANNKDLTESNFNKWAKELKLDVPRFKKDMASSSIAKQITDDQAQGTRLGARGTPSFFVNGRFLSGAQPVPSFKALIDDEMTKAKALVAAGTPRDGVYAATIAKGQPAP